MQLYLHIGTEKTGSSHLQSMAAVNRELLQKEGVHYPKGSKLEKQMLSGQISDGNAQNLTEALNNIDWETVRQLLSTYMAEARSKNCTRVLLSNELLVLAIGAKVVWEKFTSLIESAGFTHTSYLLILRDPIEQALSLYKHRAKGGTAPEIDQWAPDQYHYGKGLFDFLTAASQIRPDLVCRKYLQRQGYLEDVFFKDWLRISFKLKGFDKPINPSLNLSELTMLKNVYAQHPYLIEEFYKRFITIPKKKKAAEPRLEAYYKAVLKKELLKYPSTWKMCNEFLPNKEHLELPNHNNTEMPEIEKVLTFSTLQGEALANLLSDALSARFRWHLRYTTLRRKLGQLRQKWT